MLGAREIMEDPAPVSVRPPRRVRITDRDRTLLAFVAEHRIVLASHVQTLLGVSANAADVRLRSLSRAGMLDSERFFHGQPRCYWIVRKGLELVGSRLPAPRVDLRAYQHDIGLAWLWLAAHGGAFGPLRNVVSERRMRSSDATEAHSARTAGIATDPFAVRLGGVGAGGRERLHYPDLLLIDRNGRRAAVELELTSKTRARRERILAGYAAERRIDAVLYLVDNRSVARGIEASAARLSSSALVHVQWVRWGIPNSARTSGAERSGSRARGALIER